MVLEAASGGDELMYEVFEHTADLGVRVAAADRDGLFAEAGKAFFSVVVENPEEVRPAGERTLKIAGTEIEYLFFDWLNELLYLFETEHLLLSEFDVTVDESGLQATVRGEPADSGRHRLTHEVKAITYHRLRVEETADGWEAEVIVDI